MNRRALLGAAATAAPAAALTLATPALAQSAPDVRWRLTSSFPRNLDILIGAPETIARRVAQLTDNKFQIRVFPAGEIVGAAQALDAVQNGTVECCHTAPYYFTGKDFTFAFYTAVPFGLNTRMSNAWYRHGGGRELAAELFKGYNIVNFPAGDTGAQMGGWFRKEIKTLADIQGLKFRIAGLAGEVFAKMGAVPTQVPAADIYPALERGSIDAVEFVGPYDDEKLGLNRVAPFYYFPGFWEPGAKLHFMANQAAFDALPATYKAALEMACAEADAEMIARYDAGNPNALRRLIAAGTQLRPWPREVMAAAWKATHALYDEASDKNPLFKKTWESYRKFRDDEYAWFRVAENSYDNFAFTAAQTVK
ncbi:ABC transporter substrate-binding protein [Pseudoroseomonas wenyumeiae]|uniref:ABC transporter substrate-binding protein n=1 Tax=Teichococcus wenyumeiae TaxID=2478470 RepID=A0A3A9J5B9_9PROT|nr:TRAP transporter substrate-binding protein [Pseudoroseomonas wenyumeiae]RKK01652.1 ABC transporter substrate-binding protein [Pseudoroseomonas wenyumeiae]RMI25338.1 ABC transporter substrate-binding protein [Pseudoroseomonas wenyumeiae]